MPIFPAAALASRSARAHQREIVGSPPSDSEQAGEAAAMVALTTAAAPLMQQMAGDG
jgi:hypothetical protein